MSMIFERNHYLRQIISLSKNGRVKIITGIRRCGKSFLLKTLFTRYLRNNGIGDDRIIYLALDDISNNRLLNPMELDSYIRCLIKDNSTYYVILDEIQRVFTIVNPILTEGKILLTTNEVISAVRNAWSKYQNMTDAYCRTRSTFSSFRLANGNECVVNSNGTSYTCKFSYDL